MKPSPSPTKRPSPRHMHSVDRPICELASSVEMIDEMTRSMYGHVNCGDCLRRAIAESDTRLRVLRELLMNVEVVS